MKPPEQGPPKRRERKPPPAPKIDFAGMAASELEPREIVWDRDIAFLSIQIRASAEEEATRTKGEPTASREPETQKIQSERENVSERVSGTLRKSPK